MKHLSAAMLFCLLMSGGVLFAQTTVTHTINYAFSGLSGCTIFTNPTAEDGYTHQDVYGSIGFNSNQSALSMTVDQRTGAYGVTEYGISYPFKAYYSYTVQVYASGTQNGSANEPGEVALEIANSLPITNSGNNGCNSFPYVTTSDFSNYSTEPVAVGFGWLTSLINGKVPTQDENYLLVGALPSKNTEDTNYVYIQKVAISETSPISISPASFSANCGYPLTQTFTANNLTGLPNISGYTWSLPSGQPNGWLYNGSPAVFPITTTANTLTLTADCTASGLGSIQVAANVNGAAYATAVSTSNFSSSLPSDVAITGSNTLCSNSATSIFTLQDPPTCGNSSITWSFSDASLGSISPTTGASTTFTANNLFMNGTGTLTANVATACGTTTVSEPVNLLLFEFVTGTYYSVSNGETSPTEDMSFLGTNEVVSYGNSSQTVDVYVTPTPTPGVTLAWNFSPGFTPVPLSTFGTGGIHFTLGGPYPANTSFAVTMSSACGQSTLTIPFEVSGFTNGTPSVSPNPVHGNMVTVSMLPGNNQPAGATQRMIYAIKVTDLSGRVLQSNDYKAGVSSTNIQLSGIQPGNYFLSIFDGKKWTTKLLLMSK